MDKDNSNSRERKYLKHIIRNYSFKIRIWYCEKSQAIVPRVDFLRKPLLSFTQRQRSRKEQPSKSVAGPVLTAFARHIAAHRAERNARPERKEMISSFAFFSLPTPPFDISTARVCVCLAVTFLRNAYDVSPMCQTFSFVSNFNTGILEGLPSLVIRNSSQKYSNEGWHQFDM